MRFSKVNKSIFELSRKIIFYRVMVIDNLVYVCFELESFSVAENDKSTYFKAYLLGCIFSKDLLGTQLSILKTNSI